MDTMVDYVETPARISVLSYKKFFEILNGFPPINRVNSEAGNGYPT